MLETGLLVGALLAIGGFIAYMGLAAECRLSVSPGRDADGFVAARPTGERRATTT